MADLYRSDLIDIDLNRPLPRSNAGELLATGDNLSNRYGVRVFRQGEAVNLSGYAVTGYFIRPDMETVVITGAVSGNAAYVDLPQACYTQQGRFSLAVKISGGGITQTVRIVDGYIRTSQTDTVIDPSNVLPTLPELLAQIAVMEQATAAAQTATAEAQQAAADTLAAAQTLSAVTAPPIIPTATGEVVKISDSAERPFAGLRLYGKTTQDGTPTPDAPVPLVNVGAGGSIGVKSRGKNLAEVGSIGSVGSQYGTMATIHPFKLLAGTTYTLSFDTENTGIECYVNPNSFRSYRSFVMDGTRKNFTFSCAEDTEMIESDNGVVCLVSRSAATSDVESGMVSNVQIEIGSTATAYEPYKDGGSLTASTPNGLPGIPVSSGGNYTDADGKMWRSDVRDYGQGVDVQNVVTERVLPGTLGEQDNYGYFVNLPANSDADMVLCNRASHKGAWDLTGGMTYIPGLKRVIFSKEWFGVSTLAEFNAYLDTNELTIMYTLATPIETPIPADELAAYRAMTSQYPNTTVYNDAGAGMGVDYIADTKNYIDQRISALLNA